ncbi:MAG: NAD(P)/FAD-dependent oxidoreductase [Symbiobacteriia bacterium]
MYEVAIIGAGPTGASAATFTARAGLSTLLLDADQGVTRRAWIPNHLGFVQGIAGPDLVERGKDQAIQGGAALIPAKVKDVTRKGEGFVLVTDDDRTFEAKQVILAVGFNMEVAHHAGVSVVPGTEPHVKEIVKVDPAGRSDVKGIWAAGTCAGTSVHTIVTAGDGARVAVNLISDIKGERYTDHEPMPVEEARR